MRLTFVTLILCVLVWSSGCGDGGGDGCTGPSNHPPIIEAQADTSAALSDTLVLWAIAHDADGDDLSYNVLIHITAEEFARGYIPAAWMHSPSGRFRFWPQTDDEPQRRFTFLVEDNRGGTDTTTFAVRVYRVTE
jgi:hypothetical protein